MTEPVIALKNVSLRLGDGRVSVQVLNDVSLTIGEGETVGVVGPSGSGKSTLLMVTAGLERIDTGSVEIAGQEISKLDEDEVAAFRGRSIGIVFQSFHLIPNMTAIENVAIPLELAGIADAFEIAKRELEAVDLGHRLDHYPGELSGGEQQRVAIARALAPSPRLLIADEPTGNLDQKTGRHVADLLFRKAKERNMTMLLVTHDPSLAERCDRQIALRSGEVDLVAKQEAVSA